jgi:hypothetical protein
LRFSEWGADGIISDDPALLARTLRQGAPPGQNPRKG